jgi:hypothetical protein
MIADLKVSLDKFGVGTHALFIARLEGTKFMVEQFANDEGFVKASVAGAAKADSADTPDFARFLTFYGAMLAQGDNGSVVGHVLSLACRIWQLLSRPGLFC